MNFEYVINFPFFSGFQEKKSHPMFVAKHPHFAGQLGNLVLLLLLNLGYFPSL